MWRNLTKQPYLRKIMGLRKIKISSETHYSASSFGSKTFIVDSSLNGGMVHTYGTGGDVNCRGPDKSSRQSPIFGQKYEGGNKKLVFLSHPFGFLGSFRGYASVAEAIISTSEEDIDEIQELIEEMEKQNKASEMEKQKEFNFRPQKQQKMVGGLGMGKYFSLRKRQVKMETEAWEEAAKEYQELLVDMCEQKLAPNLPYIKSLFLGWFEPLRDAIAADQEACAKKKANYAPFFPLLPADKMAVITMHKLMALLLTGGDHGSARVVPAALTIGEAIEHEVG